MPEPTREQTEAAESFIDGLVNLVAVEYGIERRHLDSYFNAYQYDLRETLRNKLRELLLKVAGAE